MTKYATEFCETQCTSFGSEKCAIPTLRLRVATSLHQHMRSLIFDMAGYEADGRAVRDDLEQTRQGWRVEVAICVDDHRAALAADERRIDPDAS